MSFIEVGIHPFTYTEPRAEHNLTIQAEPGQPFMWWHVAPGLPDLLTAWVQQRVSRLSESNGGSEETDF